MKTLLANSVLVSALALSACAVNAPSDQVIAGVVSRDLAITPQPMREASLRSLKQMCGNAAVVPIGCTNAHGSAVWSGLSGCSLVSVIFHEYKHQQQFQHGKPLDEDEAVRYGLEMSKKYCRR